MDIMPKNVAVIIYEEIKMPKIIASFASLEIQEEKKIEFAKELYNVYIIRFPVVSGNFVFNRNNKKLKKLIKDFGIEYIISKSLVDKEFKSDLNIEKHKNDDLFKHVEAIKAYSAVQKLETLTNKKLFRSSIAIIKEDINEILINVFCEEACNVMIYEGKKVDKKQKHLLYTQLIKNKGISIVFSKDINKIISDSEIIITDDKIDLQNHADLLSNRLLYGNNPVEGNGIRIHKMFLSNTEIEDFTEANIDVLLMDEMLMILRYFNIEMEISKFVDMLNYKYSYNCKNIDK